MTAEIPKNGLFTDFYEIKVDWSTMSLNDQGTSQMKSKGNYKDGKQDGMWISWYENGQKKCEGEYKDGLEVGVWIWWDESGQKQCDGEFEDGYEVGVWIWWDENGQKFIEGDSKDGKVVIENKLKEIEYAQTHLGIDIPNNNREMKSKNENKGTKTVKISDIDMPFGSMVVFMVKWAIASIPAFLILMLLFAIFGGFFFAIFN